MFVAKLIKQKKNKKYRLKSDEETLEDPNVCMLPMLSAAYACIE